MSDEEFHALHSRAQESLQRYVTTNRAWRRMEQRQRLTLHMLDNDSEFLLSSTHNNRIHSNEMSSLFSFFYRLSEIKISDGTNCRVKSFID